MAEPTDMIVPMLRELRDEIRQGFKSNDARFVEMRAQINDLAKRMDVQREALAAESLLGRYSALHVEERLETLERKVALLEHTAEQK
jgi:hypothetical protein